MDNSTRDFFARRATIRRYDPSRPVDTELIARLFDLARMAPNTGNMQLYSAIVTTRPEAIAALAAEGHFNQPAAAGAKAIVTFCIDIHRFGRWCEARGTRQTLDNLQGLMWGAIDTSIVAQQFVSLAEMEGLGTCYLGTTTYNADAIARLLDLPDGVLPLVSVSLGWPAGEGDPKQRLPLGAVLHSETYADPSADELDAIYADTENDPLMRRFVEENSVPSLAHVFTQVRYPGEGTRAFSAKYLAEIKSRFGNICLNGQDGPDAE